jgi:hypothetical protein
MNFTKSMAKLYELVCLRPDFPTHILRAMARRLNDERDEGPQELTIFDPGVWQIINSPTSGCIKSAFYEQIWPIEPITALRSKARYAPRRRKWDEAINGKHHE